MDGEPGRLYHALLDLGRSLAGCADPDSVVEGLARILRTVVAFDHLGLLLYDGTRESLRLHAVMDDGWPSDPSILPLLIRGMKPAGSGMSGRVRSFWCWGAT